MAEEKAKKTTKKPTTTAKKTTTVKKTVKETKAKVAEKSKKEETKPVKTYETSVGIDLIIVLLFLIILTIAVAALYKVDDALHRPLPNKYQNVKIQNS